MSSALSSCFSAHNIYVLNGSFKNQLEIYATLNILYLSIPKI